MLAYALHLAVISGIFAILALSLNLVIGYTGLLSATHAAFYGIGAYAVAILLTTHGFGFFAAMLIGIVFSMGAALLIGLVLSKFKGDYYVLASVGFNIMIYAAMLNLDDITGGALGIPGISKPSVGGFTFSSTLEMFILTLILLLLIYLLVHFITKSSFGRVLKAIREDETAIQIFGYNTQKFKLTIFVLAAGMAAVAGGVYASYITFVGPSTFEVMESVFIIAMIILGGLASNKGAVVGAVIFVLLPELLRQIGFAGEIAGHMRQIIYGLLLVLLMMYRPQGMFGEYKL